MGLNAPRGGDFRASPQTGNVPRTEQAGVILKHDPWEVPLVDDTIPGDEPMTPQERLRIPSSVILNIILDDKQRIDDATRENGRTLRLPIPGEGAPPEYRDRRHPYGNPSGSPEEPNDGGDRGVAILDMRRASSAEVSSLLQL